MYLSVLDIGMLTTHRAGAKMPKNFQHIALGSRLIGILEAHGVRYNER
jgi:hypothetical protein